jgi:hypothetical protein
MSLSEANKEVRFGQLVGLDASKIKDVVIKIHDQVQVKCPRPPRVSDTSRKSINQHILFDLFDAIDHFILAAVHH